MESDYKQRISLDFDGTLGHKVWVQEMAKALVKDGKNEVHIITRRYDHPVPAENVGDEVTDVMKFAEYLGIPPERVHFLNRRYKAAKIKELGIDLHFDDDPVEMVTIRANTDCMVIKV